jgi:uncharacterized protein (TIGR03067 family)
MQVKLFAVVVLLATWTLAGTAGGNDDNTELKKLQGTWKVVYEEDSGLKMPVKPEERFIFLGDKLMHKVGEKVTGEYRIKVRPSKSPAQMELAGLKNTAPGLCLAAYKFERNKLVLCTSFAADGKRPVDFTTDGSNHNMLFYLEKIDSKEK